MNPGEKALCQLLDVFTNLDIPYMIVGSFSSNYHGISRATKDADIVVQISNEQRQQIHANLPPELEVEPQISFEMVTSTYREIINIPTAAFLIELFDLSDDLHDQERFRRRIKVKSFNREIYLPTPEDVIIQKLRWSKGANRGKDFDDVVHVLGVQGDTLDQTYLKKWTETHNTTTLLKQAYTYLA